MDDNLIRIVVVSLAVGGGALIGHFATKRAERRRAGTAINAIIRQSIMATSTMGTIFIDQLAGKGLSHQEAADLLMLEMNKAGVPVQSIKIGERPSVNSVKH